MPVKREKNQNKAEQEIGKQLLFSLVSVRTCHNEMALESYYMTLFSLWTEWFGYFETNINERFETKFNEFNKAYNLFKKARRNKGTTNYNFVLCKKALNFIDRNIIILSKQENFYILKQVIR